MRGERADFRFSLRDLALAVTVYAIFFAVFSSVPSYVTQWIAGTGVITLFVAGDFLRNRQAGEIPTWAAATFRISLCSTAMALAAVAFLLVYSNTPPESKPPVAFGLYELFSGQVLDEFARALATVLGIVLSYILLFVLFSVIGFAAACASISYYRSAVVLCCVNLPGFALLCFVVVGGIVEKWQS
jgi:hypothetical protein